MGSGKFSSVEGDRNGVEFEVKIVERKRGEESQRWLEYATVLHIDRALSLLAEEEGKPVPSGLAPDIGSSLGTLGNPKLAWRRFSY